MEAKVFYLNNKNANKESFVSKLYGRHSSNEIKELRKEMDELEYSVVDIVDVDKEDLESVYEYMNNLLIPVGHPKRKVFEKIGHTSMSMGDMIHFKDNSVFVVASIGFIQVN